MLSSHPPALKLDADEHWRKAIPSSLHAAAKADHAFQILWLSGTPANFIDGQAKLCGPVIEHSEKAATVNPATAKPEAKKEFFPELEILRGLAAVSVTWIHCLVCLIPASVYTWRSLGVQSLADVQHLIGFLLVSPFNGRNAVVFFFVLSGFVLANSMESRLARTEQNTRSRMQICRDFLIGRFFRIYPAATAITLASAAILILVTPHAIAWPGAPWFTRFFQPIDSGRVIQALCQFQASLNPVYWTLRVEMFNSCLFPAMFYLVMYRGRTGFATSWGWLAVALLISRWGWYFQFLRFLFCFPLGIIAYKLHKFRKPARLPAGWMLLLGVLLLCFAGWLGPNPFVEDLHYQFPQIILESFGAFLIIRAVTARGGYQFPAFMRWRLLSHLGRNSFSIYLIHFLILELAYFACLRLLPDAIYDHPFLVSLGFVITTVPAAILAAYPLYHGLEVPGMTVGKKVARWFGKGRIN